MAMIEVEGARYKVTESLGYQHGGGHAVYVATPDGERVAVKRGGRWTWWTAEDRLQSPQGAHVGMSAQRTEGRSDSGPHETGELP